VNYVELHLGDYAESTGHLTFIEDAAYMRLLRKCYASERPIPCGIAAAQRLVGARSDEERTAVETVLREFFELRDDGWYQARAEREIERFKANEPEREVKRANEENRVRRHREERASLFRRLTDVGQHAPWNIGIAELRAMVAALPKAPLSSQWSEPASPLVMPAGSMAATDETAPATAPATPATATQYPNTSTQTPVAIPSEAKASAAFAPLPAPMTAKERVWTLGVAVLGEKGRPKLGKLVSTHGEALVLDALQATAREEPGDPYPWLVAACEARASAARVNGNGPLEGDQRPPWLHGTGFDNVFDAENAGCRKGNAGQYREGRKVATA
jgi:uncharacterized protein YdaU (DUF1376 family)